MAAGKRTLRSWMAIGEILRSAQNDILYLLPRFPTSRFPARRIPNA
jgi:hypothetical protein